MTRIRCRSARGTAGPGQSTTLVAGDVIGHAEAARQASYIRAALATFATFTSGPAELLQLAHTTLVERASNQAKFVSAVRVKEW
jgi:Stage II sporulation protein E (SpoIIE)